MTGRVRSTAGHCWKAASGAKVAAWPHRTTIGTPSQMASVMGVMRLVTPGPLVATTTPACIRPSLQTGAHLAKPSAMWPAELSFELVIHRIFSASPPWRGWSTWNWSRRGRTAPPE